MGNVIVSEKFMQRSPAKDKVAFFQNVYINQISILKYRITKLTSLLVILSVINVAGIGLLLSKKYCGPNTYAEQVQTQLPPAPKTVPGNIVKAAPASPSELNVTTPLIPGDSVAKQTEDQAPVVVASKDQTKMIKTGWVALVGSKSTNADGKIGPAPMAVQANPAAAPQPLGKYVGSKTSNKYHHPHCQWVKQIAPGNLLGFSSVEEAQTQGYVQCRYCRPPLKEAPEDSTHAKVKH